VNGNRDNGKSIYGRLYGGCESEKNLGSSYVSEDIIESKERK